MDNRSNNWLTEMPFDYEFKYYKLLAMIKHIALDIKNYKFMSTILLIEDNLSLLYDIKFGLDNIGLTGSKAIGIDLDSMRVEYDYPEEIVEVNSMHDLCDVAIKLFENIHKELRTSWRNVADMINISNIGLNSIKNHGFVYIIYFDEILTYTIDIPMPINTTWKNVKLVFVSCEIYDINKLSMFIKSSEVGLKHFRCNINNVMPIEECAIPIIKSILYKNLI